VFRMTQGSPRGAKTRPGALFRRVGLCFGRRAQRVLSRNVGQRVGQRDALGADVDRFSRRFADRWRRFRISRCFRCLFHRSIFSDSSGQCPVATSRRIISSKFGRHLSQVSALCSLCKIGERGQVFPKFLDHLDVEYAISSGIAHGSQGLLGDVFRKTEDDSGYHQQSAWFRSSSLAIRIACHLILAFIGVEQVDAAAMHMRSLNLLIGNEPNQSVQIYTENTLVSILTAGFAGSHPHAS
jgi:hypothetical protein